MESMEALCSIAHVAREDEVRGRLQRLPFKTRRRSQVGIIISCQRAIKSNPDVGVCRAFLEQTQIRENINILVPDNSSYNPPTTLLHAAVVRGAQEIVELLLAIPEVDLNVRSFGDGSMTPLHLACFLSRSEIVDLLLNDRRVDLTAKTLHNRTALHCACGDWSQAEFRHGFPTVPQRKSTGCKKLEVVRILLRAAAAAGTLLQFMNETDNCGRTALHYASENNLTSIVEEIFNAGADVLPVELAQDSQGLMPVHWAAQKGHGEVVCLLLRRAPHTLHSKDDEALTPLDHAVQGGHLHILQPWISQCVSKSASEQQIVNIFNELLKITRHYDVAVFLVKELDQHLQASSPSRRNVKSLLHWAVDGCASTLIPQILKWQPHLANEILDREKKQTLLHISTISGQLHVVEALCREQGWVLQANKKDKFNKRALDYAYGLGHKDVCEHLMQRSDVKDYISMLQREQANYVTAANAILVVAALIAGASYASCVKPLAHPPSNASTNIYLILPTTFLTSVTATILGACAASPLSFGKRCDDIGHKLGHIRVLVALASCFLLVSVATMVFSFVCSGLGMATPQRAKQAACLVFSVTSASVMLLAFVTYFGKALYYRVKQLSWRTMKS